MEKVKDKVIGIELFAKFTSAVVQYSILGGYVVFASVAHVINRVRELKKNGKRD